MLLCPEMESVLRGQKICGKSFPWCNGFAIHWPLAWRFFPKAYRRCDWTNHSTRQISSILSPSRNIRGSDDLASMTGAFWTSIINVLWGISLWNFRITCQQMHSAPPNKRSSVWIQWISFQCQLELLYILHGDWIWLTLETRIRDQPLTLPLD